MTGQVYVYGQSDDIVEVVGDENEEMYVTNTPHTVEVCGVSIVAEYDGGWSFEVVSNPNDTHVVVLPKDVIDRRRFCDYSELVVIDL